MNTLTHLIFSFGILFTSFSVICLGNNPVLLRISVCNRVSFSPVSGKRPARSSDRREGIPERLRV